MNGFSIEAKRAGTESERNEIYRLRYRVYVAEMGKPYQSATNSDLILTDSLDRTAILIYLRDSHGSTIGTVRCNYAADVIAADPLSHRLKIERLPTAALPHVTVCSRLVLAPGYRRRRALWPLVRAIYRWGLEHDIHLNLVHCNPLLVPLFEHLGFRQFGEPFTDAQAGSKQQPLYLLLRDASHLRAVRSPFLDELGFDQTACAGCLPDIPAPFVASGLPL